MGMWTVGSTTYVSGYAINAAGNKEEAVLWTVQAPEPSSAVLLVGAGLMPLLRRWRRA